MAEKESAAFSRRMAVPLDRGSRVPLSRQIVDHLWQGVVAGDLEPGHRLPTVRQLAIDLGVNPNTVERSYHELELLGVITTRNREGTFVCLEPPARDRLERRHRFDDLCATTVSQAVELGFSIDDLIDALGELRSRTDGGAAKEY